MIQCCFEIILEKIAKKITIEIYLQFNTRICDEYQGYLLKVYKHEYLYFTCLNFNTYLNFDPFYIHFSYNFCIIF